MVQLARHWLESEGQPGRAKVGVVSLALVNEFSREENGSNPGDTNMPRDLSGGAQNEFCADVVSEVLIPWKDKNAGRTINPVAQPIPPKSHET